MIDKLNIGRFKCFKEVIIPLKNITLLTGTNSSGKSTVIQALLLLANNAEEINTSPLNGMRLQLGRFEECRNHIINARSFAIMASMGNSEFFYLEFRGNDDNEDLATIWEHKRSILIEKILSPKEEHLFYIPANRQGPVDSYNKSFDSRNSLGIRAEFIIDYLFRHQKEPVFKELQKEKHSVTLLAQVNYWLQLLLGVSIVIHENKGSNTYSIEYRKNGGKGVRPYHIGSGISYALAVVISCLSAQQDDIVILENPEIHLHPKAQAELTEFLCFIANAGIQIIVETHSDHVFNGIRKAVVKKTISHNDTSIQYFVQDDVGLSENINIELNEHGRVLEHQKGLFDQFDEDLDVIIGI